MKTSEIYELTNKIPEVWTIARVVAQKYEYMEKFARHIAALIIKNTKVVPIPKFVSKI
ncbi:MAG: hypothetical protein QXL94_02800 [Candidatus Parvarchaeum sp.]